MNRNAAEQFEVGLVQRKDRANSCSVKRRSELQQALASETILPHPAKELRDGIGGGKDLYGFGGVPELFGAIECDIHCHRIENVIRQVLARQTRRYIQSTLMPRGFRLSVRGCRPSYRSLLVTL